jgi:Tfp pilus assembly protein PilE
MSRLQIKIQQQIGFGMIEAIIIVLVVGAIAILGLLSFQAVQAKSRDTSRRNAIDAVASALEDCYNNKCESTYPTLLQLTDTASGGFVDTNLGSFNTTNLYDSSAGIIQSDAASAATQYQYTVEPTSCSGTGGAIPCTGFTLKAFQETNVSNPYVKESLHK